MKHATVHDVAEQAGVGTTTVSTVLNGHADRVGISQATRLRVRAAAERLRYQPSAAARALRQRRTRTLGLIVSDACQDGLRDPNFIDALAAIESACERRGYGLRVSRYNLTNIASFAIPPAIGSQGVDAAILAFAVEAAVAVRFREFGLPCLILGCEAEQAGILPTLFSRRGMLRAQVDAIAHAAAIGHRRFGHFVGKELPFADHTRDLIAAAASDPRTTTCGVEEINRDGHGQTFAGGVAIARRWLAAAPAERPTCVMASEHTLMAFLCTLAERGFTCPRDISVISLDDSHLCRFIQPGLTAVAWDLPGVAARAVDLLVDHLDHGRPLEAESLEASHRLVVRGSCAAPR